MERVLIVREGTNRTKVIQDLAEEVNTRFGDGWEVVSGTLVEFVAPRRGGYRYAFVVQMDKTLVGI